MHLPSAESTPSLPGRLIQNSRSAHRPLRTTAWFRWLAASAAASGYSLTIRRLLQMKTQNFFGAALLGLAFSFSAHAQTVPVTPGTVGSPTVGTGTTMPNAAGAPGPSGAAVPGAVNAPIGATSTLDPAGNTSAGTSIGSATGTMTTTPGATRTRATTRTPASTRGTTVQP